MSDEVSTGQFVYIKPEYPHLNLEDGTYVYAGPEYIPPFSPNITTSPNITNITTITPPICKICKFYDRCSKFSTTIVTLKDCKKGLGIEEKSVKIKVKRKPRQ